MTGRTFWLALLLALAAIAGACETQAPPRFPHLVHMSKPTGSAPGQPKYLTCVSCHPGVQEPAAAVFPDTAVCAECHKDKRVEPREMAAPPIRFEHDYHLNLPAVHGQCVVCHVGVTQASASAYPPMAACLACHQKDFDRARCTPCHESRERLSAVPPQTFMRHDAGWMRHHGPAATGGQKICTQCHAQAQCDDCHDTRQRIPVEVRQPEAVESGAIHRGDFLTRHSIEARSQPVTCLRCHAPSSCDACHVARGISANALGSGSPHPRGWANGPASSPDFHGRAARHDILQCVACHERGEATNCILCHKVGGPGGRPHPGVWNSTRSPRSDTPCRYCHGGAR